MVKKITLSELNDKLLDPQANENELAQYFKASAREGKPFSIDLEIDLDKVAINTEIADAATRSAALLNVANNLARMKRVAKFNSKIADGYSGPIIVSEGDSWFQYPILLRDVIDCLMDNYAIRSLDAAGDLIRDMERTNEYTRAIASTRASVFLLSGGGNDLVAEGNLANHVAQYRPGAQAADLLLPSFDALVGSVIATYRRIFDKLTGTFSDLQILCHGYDLPTPAKGPWLGKPLARKKIVDPVLQKDIVALMMNRFNEELSRASAAYARVHFVDGRGIVKSRWHDELHPDNTGFADVAEGFTHVIDDVTQPKRRKRGAGETSERPAPDRSVRALSLHIGLNAVDPVHYQGWDGVLGACEYDAEDMAAIAQSRSFSATTLLTAQATREAVLDAIGAATTKLEAGDIFFISYARHGGQVPDYGGDELDDRRDETWCLFDGELLDDELFECWTRFAEGVRILVVSDSCHSGSVTRMALSAVPRSGHAVLSGSGSGSSNSLRQR